MAWKKTLGLFGLVTILFGFGFAMFLRVQPTSDLDIHIDHARRMQSIANPEPPEHFLFQLLLRALHAVGLSYEAATVLLLGGCYGGMAVLIVREIDRRGVSLSAARVFVVVPALLIASHVFLLTMFRPNIYYGYFTPIVYHNPTQQLNKLFAVWIYFLYRSHFLSTRPAAVRSVPALGALCVLSALAKPSFLVAFVPTAALYALRDLVKRRWRQALLCLAGIGIPSALILTWQARIAYGMGAPVEVAFLPFVVFKAVPTLYKLPASLAFPLVVAIACRWRPVDEGLRFIWILTGLALFATLGLVEAGPRMMEGNFAWTGQTAVFLLYVESVLVLISRPARLGERFAWAVFALHVVCGIAWYAATLSQHRPEWL